MCSLIVRKEGAWYGELIVFWEKERYKREKKQKSRKGKGTVNIFSIFFAVFAWEFLTVLF